MTDIATTSETPAANSGTRAPAALTPQECTAIKETALAIFNDLSAPHPAQSGGHISSNLQTSSRRLAECYRTVLQMLLGDKGIFCVQDATTRQYRIQIAPECLPQDAQATETFLQDLQALDAARLGDRKEIQWLLTSPERNLLTQTSSGAWNNIYADNFSPDERAAMKSTLIALHDDICTEQLHRPGHIISISGTPSKKLAGFYRDALNILFNETGRTTVETILNPDTKKYHFHIMPCAPGEDRLGSRATFLEQLEHFDFESFGKLFRVRDLMDSNERQLLTKPEQEVWHGALVGSAGATPGF